MAHPKAFELRALQWVNGWMAPAPKYLKLKNETHLSVSLIPPLTHFKTIITKYPLLFKAFR